MAFGSLRCSFYGCRHRGSFARYRCACPGGCERTARCRCFAAPGLVCVRCWHGIDLALPVPDSARALQPQLEGLVAAEEERIR